MALSTEQREGFFREQDARLIVEGINTLPALLDAADERDKLAANPRDEYHTMEELYEYRMLYNALAANAMPDRAVKSWRHSDGETCFGGGWFVVYLHLPTGQVSNHYKAEHWDLFRVPEVEIAPEWDGHTPAVAADRLRRALTGQHAANEEREREMELEDAVPYPIPSVRDGWYQIDCPWCDWYTTGFEPVCEDAWYTHKAEKGYVEKPEHNAEPLTANEELEQELEDAWQSRDWETVRRLQNEAEREDAPEPDPLDENDHRDRIDGDGRRWGRMDGGCWHHEGKYPHAFGRCSWTLQQLQGAYGLLTFAPEAAQDAPRADLTASEVDHE